MQEEGSLYRKIRGSLYGGAVGDALGGPTEGRDPAEIRERYGEVLDFVEPWDGPSPVGKGNGRHTDDTHMIRVLCEMYIDAGQRLDVFDFTRGIGRRIGGDLRYISEWGREAPLVDRLFHPEKWLFLQHGVANADPRSGGVGNMVNCGAAMYAAPVGIVNACRPERAYRDAIDIFSAHQHSFGLEAAGVMAFAVAHAFLDCTIEEIYDACLERAHEGTRMALEALRPIALAGGDWRALLPRLREAIAPIDTAPEDFKNRGSGQDHWRPSRTHSIEEVPIALALALACDGDFDNAVVASANYGRDCDSIAGMAGSVLGAWHGDAGVRADWIGKVNEANRMDLDSLARGMTDLVAGLERAQLETEARQSASLRHLL